MSNIFISYRRADSKPYAGRLFDRLKAHFGAEHVFIDVAGIEPSLDFVDRIREAMAGCDACVVVIGRQWTGITDAAGRRRLLQPGDLVRSEVAMALAMGKRVFPVCVDGAPMPTPDELPEDIRPLAAREATELSDTRWDFDTDRLIGALEAGREPDGPADGAAEAAFAVLHPRGYIASAMRLFLLFAPAWTVLMALLEAAVNDLPFRETLLGTLPAGLVTGVLFALAMAYFARGETLAVRFTNRGQFVAKANLVMSELGFLPASASPGLLTFRPSLSAGLGYGRITFVLEDGRATIVGAHWYVRRIRKRLG